MSAVDRFRQALAHDRCWDTTTQAIFEKRREPVDDCILQNREELIVLCALIEALEIRSFLEVGIWTGRLVRTLHRIFGFERVAACDHGYAEKLGLTIAVPNDAPWLRDNSESPAYRAWRAELGNIDLVFIDANHRYAAVKRDFEINRAFPHRFLAFHDIVGANRHTEGVARFWNELDEGHKLEIVRPHAEIGSSTPTMGIGLWSERPFPEAARQLAEP